MRETQKVVLRMDAILSDGGNVGVHCRMGVGRSGVLAACCLVRCGMDSQSALNRVSDARGWSVPDTDEQREWVARFSREHSW